MPHRCWVFEGAAIEALGLLKVDDLHFLWLPLAHSFGKVLLSAMYQIGLPTATDGREEVVGDRRPAVGARRGPVECDGVLAVEHHLDRGARLTREPTDGESDPAAGTA